jgi:class 3 adenylate cyclase
MDYPTGTVPFLFTDVEGSTRRWEQQPEAIAQAFARQEVLLREVLTAYYGYAYKMIGDAFQVAFQTAPAALAATLAAQRALIAEDWGVVDPVRIRIWTG